MYVFSAGSAPASGAGFGALAEPSAAQGKPVGEAPTGAAEAAALPALNGYGGEGRVEGGLQLKL